MIKWFLNRRAQKKLSSQASHKEHEVLFNASFLLKTQLIGSNIKNQTPYAFFKSNFTRGYIMGFFSSALENANLNPKNANDHAILMSLGHSYLFYGDMLASKKYTLDSLVILASDDKEFIDAAEFGFDEYTNAVNKSESAFGLLKHLMSHKK